MTPGALLRDARKRHGVSQQSLARRAGTTQSAISRIERGGVSPTVETLSELLHLVGEELVLAAKPTDSGIDRSLIRERLALTASERLDYGVAIATQIIENSPNVRREKLSMVPEPLPPKAPNLRKLLEPLVTRGVDFVVVGGMAGISYGSNYPSFDLDVAYSRDRANVARLVEALEPIGVRLRRGPDDLPFVLDARTIENGANFTFVTPFGDLDVLGDVAGIKSYEELREAAVEKEVSGIPVRVASLDDLISMKRAANRTKDKLMVEEYLVIADELQRRRGDRG